MKERRQIKRNVVKMVSPPYLKKVPYKLCHISTKVEFVCSATVSI